MSKKDEETIFFVVWLLNKAAKAWGKTSSETYRILQSVNLVDDYVLPCFDVLHTMGELALVEDLECAARERGLWIRHLSTDEGVRVLHSCQVDVATVVDQQTIAAIEELRITNLEARIVEILAERLGIGAGGALQRYYDSELACLIEGNAYGLQYLDEYYLAEELLAEMGGG